ncbi:MAG: DNA topoisomerase 4 subunit A [Acidobacteria bacterium]|nr:MAG: DNA topoisomerase 4 subunit A [Acidobacteriota bacterium]MCE7957108.1 DNA topoisomerase 4 subunit A [Acidobacteria bacterium ACB2]
MARKRETGQAALSFDAEIALPEEARRRYLNYALSVITSRALPDVRDGLKPVQRRILFAMYQNLHLMPDARFKKSAAVVGDVIAKYHPHGDVAIYDAMVRMAQDFSLRVPLVDGHGNFGSLDGDAAAAYRYTEARLRQPAVELLSEIRKRTVDWRPTFDGTHFEPVVLPARFPNLLVNGATGIAVGMATSIPPHNPLEVLDAAIAAIDDPSADPLKSIKGPDFPTGGQLLSTKRELREVYETGQGSLKLRAEWELEEGARGAQAIVVTSVPYGVAKASLVEKIAEVIVNRRLPALVDVRDESTSDVRVVLELKRDADPALVMTYLYKHTPLQTTVPVNLTCLVPTPNPEVTEPARLPLAAILRHFLDFRLATVRRRFEFELDELRKRIHLLEGFVAIFDALDEAIRIIRGSDGKADAAAKLMKRFGLDEEQADAILETKLYKLAKLEIKELREELAAKKAEAAKIEAVLRSEAKLWGVVQRELVELRGLLSAEKRRTRVVASADEPEYVAEAFIQHEDTTAVLSSDGWVKRVRELKDPKSTRLREGDSVQAVLQGSTKELAALFSNQGSAYVLRLNDVPPSTGYGEPVQKLFKFADGERVVAALSLDPRVLPDGDVLLLAVTRGGMVMRFPLSPYKEPTTRSGRRFAKTGEADEVLFVGTCEPGAIVALASERGRAILFSSDEVPVLSGPGKGVIGIKLGADDRVVGAALFGKDEKRAVLTLENSKGTTYTVTRRYDVVGRAGKGFELIKRDRFTRMVPPEVTLQDLNGTAS